MQWESGAGSSRCFLPTFFSGARLCFAFRASAVISLELWFTPGAGMFRRLDNPSSLWWVPAQLISRSVQVYCQRGNLLSLKR